MDTSLVAQMVTNLPATQEIEVRSLVGKIPCRRKWLPTPLFLPGEFHGQRSLEPGRLQSMGAESDMTEQLTHTSAVYICQSQSPSSSHPSFPTLMPICLFSISVSLCSVLQIRSSMCGWVLYEIKNEYRCLTCFFERDERYWETFVSYWEMTQVRWKHFEKLQG